MKMRTGNILVPRLLMESVLYTFTYKLHVQSSSAKIGYVLTTNTITNMLMVK